MNFDYCMKTYASKYDDKEAVSYKKFNAIFHENQSNGNTCMKTYEIQA